MTQLSLTAEPARAAPPGPILWVGLNPSVATDEAPDHTIRKEQGFLRTWGVALVEPKVGYQGDRSGLRGEHRFVLTRPGMIKVNLFSVRAKVPKWMLEIERPNHEHNDMWIAHGAREARTVIAAWGGPFSPKRLQEQIEARAREVVELLKRAGAPPLMCLGTSQNGIPRHPLMLAYATKLEPWRTT